VSWFGRIDVCELAAAMPELGGEYVYLSAAYGLFGASVRVDAIWVAKSGSIATLAAGFLHLLTAFAPVLAKPYWYALSMAREARGSKCIYGQLVPSPCSSFSRP